MGTKSTIKGLGEVALQVNDLDAMQAFYHDVVGLELMRRFEHSAFFKVADGHGGHTQIIALFDRVGDGSGYAVENAYRRPPIDHFAFEISLEDHSVELARLNSLGVKPSVKDHPWTQWRSIFVNDPEGNTVEWVCHDPSISDDHPEDR